MRYFHPDAEYTEQLVGLRIAYINSDHGQMPPDEENEIRKNLKGYFKEHLGKDLFAFAAEEDGEAIACAMLLVTMKPASPSFPTGRVGTVLSVYTKPEFRRRGIAKKLMQMLLGRAEELHLDHVELKATEDGYPLYKALGFEECKGPYTEMKYPIGQ